MIGQSTEENNTIIGNFLKSSADKAAKMEEVSQALYLEIATQTQRINERVVELNTLKEVALNQTADLNRRSIEIEQKFLDIEKKLIDADTKHGDLITNFVEFGEIRPRSSRLSAQHRPRTSRLSAPTSRCGQPDSREGSRAKWADWEACKRVLEALEAQRRRRNAHRWTARK